ncbi:AraC family transcriptional regulator [Motiliproteus sp.]|uniref:AraC family transcriptional regulator n=1 Tax=Motiliproteus sp. TaxID=1898955 RepID=UPI003BAD3AB8
MATVDIHYVQAALRCAERRGHAPEALLEQVGIWPQQLSQPRAPAAQMAALVQQVWALLDDEFMGCTVRPCKRGVFAMMTRHALHYDNLQAILQQGIEFYNLFTDDIQMHLKHRGELAEIEFCFVRPELDPDHFYREFWLVIWHRFASWVIGRGIRLQQVAFPYSRPAHSSELKYLFPCPHRFDQPMLKLSFHADYLTQERVRSQRDLAQFLRDSPRALMVLPDDNESYRARIRSRLLNQEAEQLQLPAFEQLAAEFGLSGQTLRRRLKAEGSSYPRIKDEVRQDLAIEKLRVLQLPVAEIAEQLGFSEARSFTRAFRQWTGYSPSEYRQLLNF